MIQAEPRGELAKWSEAREWDVTVVGAGPAGCLAARQLALAGCSVLLVERSRLPRQKVCGGCLSLTALRCLEEAGLSELPRRLGGVKLRSMHWAHYASQVDLTLPGGYSISRAALDAALWKEAMAAGAVGLPATQVTGQQLLDGGRRLELRSGGAVKHVCARVVLWAGGLATTPRAAGGSRDEKVARRSRLGGGWLGPVPNDRYAPGVVYMASGRNGYVGLVRVEKGWLNVAVALSPTSVRAAGGLGRAVARQLDEAGWPALPDVPAAEWRGTPLLTRTPAAVAGQRLLVLGDAAGYVEPFTGEGIGWAMATALAAVPLVLKGVRQWHPDLQSAWSSWHQQYIGPRQRRCRWIARGLRCGPAAGWVARVVATRPRWSRPLVDVVFGG